MLTRWTDRRLTRLYTRYNWKYWDGALPEDIIITNGSAGDENFGITVWAPASIIIDVSRHRSDRAVRDTLLHEMCHVATGPTKPGLSHNSAFFEQLEHLLSRKAPITVGLPEAGDALYLEMIPEQFPLSRRRFKRAAARYHRRESAAAPDMPGGYTLELLENSFEDAARRGIPWSSALREIGHEFGLVDIDNKPLPKFQKWIDRAREVHREAYTS